MKKNIFLLAALLLICTLLPITASADFGNYDTYEDFGSAGGWSDGWGDSWSDDWGSGNTYYVPNYDSDDTDFDDLPFVILIIFVIVVVYLDFFNKGKANAPDITGRKMNDASNVPQNKTVIISAKIKETDENFSADAFLSFANSSYVVLQNSWSQRDAEKLRLLLSEELYSQTKAQIDEYINIGRVNVMERISVRESYITDYSSDDDTEALTIYLYATQKDYIIDEKTGNVIEGSKDSYRHSKYMISYIRKAGEKTESIGKIEANNCPNCGAPLEISATGRCAYCDSIISNDNHSWVISSMKRIN